jgi:hypothetical protein
MLKQQGKQRQFQVYNVGETLDDERIKGVKTPYNLNAMDLRKIMKVMTGLNDSEVDLYISKHLRDASDFNTNTRLPGNIPKEYKNFTEASEKFVGLVSDRFQQLMNEKGRNQLVLSADYDYTYNSGFPHTPINSRTLYLALSVISEVTKEKYGITSVPNSYMNVTTKEEFTISDNAFSETLNALSKKFPGIKDLIIPTTKSAYKYDDTKLMFKDANEAKFTLDLVKNMFDVGLVSTKGKLQIENIDLQVALLSDITGVNPIERQAIEEVRKAFNSGFNDTQPTTQGMDKLTNIDGPAGNDPHFAPRIQMAFEKFQKEDVKTLSEALEDIRNELNKGLNPEKKEEKEEINANNSIVANVKKKLITPRP